MNGMKQAYAVQNKKNKSTINYLFSLIYYSHAILSLNNSHNYVDLSILVAYPVFGGVEGEGEDVEEW